MDESRDAQAVLWFVILNGVAARDDASGLDGLGMSALQNGADILFRQAVRHAQKVHCEFRLAAHGVHVAQRVRRGDLTEEIRIVHNGVKKSTVSMTATSSETRYTAASSLLS